MEQVSYDNGTAVSFYCCFGEVWDFGIGQGLCEVFICFCAYGKGRERERVTLEFLSLAPNPPNPLPKTMAMGALPSLDMTNSLATINWFRYEYALRFESLSLMFGLDIDKSMVKNFGWFFGVRLIERKHSQNTNKIAVFLHCFANVCE